MSKVSEVLAAVQENARTRMKLEAFIEFGRSLRSLSTCTRAHVAAIVFPTDFSRILAIGYNGVPAGIDNASCSGESQRCGCVHAEMNACIKLDAAQHQQHSLIMWSGFSPCLYCTGVIINCQAIGAVPNVPPLRAKCVGTADAERHDLHPS